MAKYFRRSYNKIISLALFYIINIILIKYNTLYIDIITFKTFYIKNNIFNLVYHLFLT